MVALYQAQSAPPGNRMCIRICVNITVDQYSLSYQFR